MPSLRPHLSASPEGQVSQPSASFRSQGPGVRPFSPSQALLPPSTQQAAGLRESLGQTGCILPPHPAVHLGEALSSHFLPRHFRSKPSSLKASPPAESAAFLLIHKGTLGGHRILPTRATTGHRKS